MTKSHYPWRWIAVIAMMAVTFLFGTDLFSSENTRPIITWIMRLLFGPGAEVKTIGTGEGLLRKSAHFLEYALLAWLWFRALRETRQYPVPWQWYAIAMLATTFWASIDELQQGYLSTNRTGNPWDVVLDASGAATALLLTAAVRFFRQRSAADSTAS